MQTQHININDILVEESRFSLRHFIFESDSLEASLRDSFKHFGILQPVIIQRENNSRFHLIDGRKRIQFAIHNHIKEISAIVLAESTPVEKIINLILCCKRMEIEQSVMNKILFICFAMSLNAPEAWISEALCIPFAFKPHGEFLEDCKRINSLSSGLKLFCHEKKFSMKQILNLAHYPEDMLLQLMQWKPVLQLTASTLDELASNLKDYLQAQHMTIKDLIAEACIQEIIQSPMSPRDRTEKLRQLINRKRYPILTEANSRIGEKVAQLNLPEEISIDWDKTLENKEVDVTVHVRDANALTGLLNKLNSDKMKKTVEEILGEL